ncbi:MAG: tRNA dihydrouridine synthase DusB [Clostridia bacterium]|nr:tRNA dihydrouridine synthase DusB [Clostridia bacterium]
MKIGNIELKNNLILAPMAGVTDVGFRSLAISYGADYAVGEMVSAKALKYKNKKTADLLITAPNESIKVAQIFGSDPKIMASIVKSKYLNKFDIIDINMGCPAPKIVKNGEGSALMQNIELAEQIVSECVKASTKPITVKFRAGWNNNINAVEFAKMCERAGASAITIHGRTREQFYAGKSDLELIKQVKQAVNIPVIGNGDVVDVESYNAMLKTGVDAVMVGRGALGNPEIFAELTGKKVEVNKFEDIKKHISILREHYPEHLVVKEMRKHILWYLKGYHNCTEIKNQVVREKDINKVLEILKNFFENNKKRESN